MKNVIRDKLSLRGMRFDCVVGVLDHERLMPQPVDLDIALYFDTRPAARDGKLRHTIDYVRLAGELRFIMTASRFSLLESAAEALAAWVLAPPTVDVPRPQIDAVDIQLAKPQALSGAGLPVIEIHRESSDFAFTTETKSFGHVDVIFETRECGVYRERIAPGATLAAHVHHHLDESELVLGSGLHLQGKPVSAGLARTWPRGFAHRYDNPSLIEQSFLCIDRPAFIPSDEVETPSAPLQDLEATRFF